MQLKAYRSRRPVVVGQEARNGLIADFNGIGESRVIPRWLVIYQYKNNPYSNYHKNTFTQASIPILCSTFTMTILPTMASPSSPFEAHQITSSYKHMWARSVAQATMDYDFGGVLDLVKESVPGASGIETIGELAEATKDKTGNGFIPRADGQIDVGIVGAGVAGLFAALLFDWLNDHPRLEGKGLKINYDILEAAGADRLGGRLYTHHFSDEEHDYYDVGAMRFPNNSIMKR